VRRGGRPEENVRAAIKPAGARSSAGSRRRRRRACARKYLIIILFLSLRYVLRLNTIITVIIVT
jgi:hypothetical protein